MTPAPPETTSRANQRRLARDLSNPSRLAPTDVGFASSSLRSWSRTHSRVLNRFSGRCASPLRVSTPAAAPSSTCRAPARRGHRRHRRGQGRSVPAGFAVWIARPERGELQQSRQERVGDLLARRGAELDAVRLRPASFAYRGERGARVAGTGRLRADRGHGDRGDRGRDQQLQPQRPARRAARTRCEQRRGGRATRAHALRRGRHRFPGRCWTPSARCWPIATSGCRRKPALRLRWWRCTGLSAGLGPHRRCA